MAIFHLSVKPVSRAGGRSATAASAYRAAELVHDHTTGQTFDYTRKRGVEHEQIVLPTSAAERAENRSNSRVAREYEIALPHELSKEQRLELVRGFAGEIANRHGVAVDFAIHAPHREGDERNWHAHLLATTREITPTGLGEKVSIEWSDGNRRKAELGPAKEEIGAIRERWATLTNEKLHEHGHEIRIDHRSLEAQGIEREPTTHLGPAVSGMERRGIETEVGKRLDREALEAGQERLEKAVALGKIEREELALTASIVDVSGNIEAAKRERERDLMLKHQVELAREPKLSIEELQRQGREKWLGMRAEQQAREKSPEQTAEKVVEKAPARSIDEERQQAAERWQEYRRNQELGQGQGPPGAPERSGLEKERGLSRERDGPELE